MALSVGRLLGVTAQANVEYGVLLSPSFVSVRVPSNGGSTSPLITATVSAGVGPFTYEFTTNQSRFDVIAGANENEVFIQCSGFNQEVEGILTCKVIDTGNADEETTDEITVLFLFGTLP